MAAPPIHKLGERPTHSRICVYSAPGLGKTALACSSPNVLILNADGPDGPEAARALGYNPSIWDIDGENPFEELDNAYKYIRRYPDKYEWVWLDSATLFQDKSMDEIMEDVHKAKPHRSIYLPDKPEYQLNQNQLSKWIRHMTALPINFGFTAHEARFEDDDGETVYLPMIQGGQGALSSKLCAWMGIVGRLTVETTRVREEGSKRRETTSERRLQVQWTGKHYAKDRLSGGRLGEYVSDPTIPKIMEGINAPAARKPKRRPVRKSTATSRRTR